MKSKSRGIAGLLGLLVAAAVFVVAVKDPAYVGYWMGYDDEERIVIQINEDVVIEKVDMSNW